MHAMHACACIRMASRRALYTNVVPARMLEESMHTHVWHLRACRMMSCSVHPQTAPIRGPPAFHPTACT